MQLRVPGSVKQAGFLAAPGEAQHRLNDNPEHTPMATAERRPTTKWLVCNTLAQGCEVASNIRQCPCGTQLWVSALMTALVDSGQLRPMCQPCHTTTGRTVTIHPHMIDELTRLGRLDDGWQVIAEMNKPQPATRPQPGPNHPPSTAEPGEDRQAEPGSPGQVSMPAHSAEVGITGPTTAGAHPT